MAIIYTYPLITPTLSDSILVTDAADKNKTKTASINSLKDTLGVIDTVSGVSPIQVAMNPSAHSAAVSLSTVPVNLGGTNITNYSAGDIIYASSQGLQKLPIGNSGEVLKVSNSLPAWGTDSSGAEGSGFGGEVALWTGSGSTNILTGSMLKQVGSGVTAKMVIGGNPNNGLTFENTGTAIPDVTLLPFNGSSGPNWEMRLPGPPQGGGQVMALPSTLGSSPYQLEWADVAIPNQSGQAGNFLTTDGSTMSWTQAQGGGTITGGGVQDRLAFYSGTSAITSHPELRTTSGGTLIVGNEAGQAAGNLFLENSTGVIGGRIRLYAMESTNPGTPKYVTIQASESASASSYNLYFPPTVANSAGQVLTSAGADARLEWTTPQGTTYSAGTGLTLTGTSFSLSSGAALTNLSGGTGTTYLKKDGTWDTPASGIGFSGNNTVGGLVSYENSTTGFVNSGIKISQSLTTSVPDQILANAGTSAIPPYSFSSYTNSGMKYSGGNVCIVQGGVDVLKVNSTNVEVRTNSGNKVLDVGATSIATDQPISCNQGIKFQISSGVYGDILEDYEEGTFNLSAYVTTGPQPTLSQNSKGTYTKIGNTVHIRFNINYINLNGSNTLPMVLTGLPFSGLTGTGEVGGGYLWTSPELAESPSSPILCVINGSSLQLKSLKTISSIGQGTPTNNALWNIPVGGIALPSGGAIYTGAATYMVA